MLYFNTKTQAIGLSVHDVRAANPESSIPDGATFGDFVPYADSVQPSYDAATHELREVAPSKVGGVLTQRWEVAARARPLVPARVTRRQARQALLLAGLLDQVPAAIAAIPDPIQRGMAEIEWADSTEFHRDRPLLIGLGQALGLDSAAMDALFIKAAKL